MVGIFLIPVLYVVFQRLRERAKGVKPEPAPPTEPVHVAPGDTP